MTDLSLPIDVLLDAEPQLREMLSLLRDLEAMQNPDVAKVLWQIFEARQEVYDNLIDAIGILQHQNSKGSQAAQDGVFLRAA